MPTVLKKLGVRGINIPAKFPKVVTPADFSIGGIIGFFERQYAKAFKVNNMDQLKDIFGEDISSSWYGSEEAQLFFSNLAGVNGSLYVKAHVGYNGSVIDAVQASATVTDENGLPSALLFANELKAKLNLHGADGAQHTTHIDGTNLPITTPNAQDLSTLLALVNAMVTAYTAHETDASKSSLWAYHKAQETGTHALASTTAVTTLAGAITMLTDFRTKYLAHDADATAHGVGSSHQVVAIAPTATPASTLKIGSGYQGEIGYGLSGNRTAYQITTGIRFTTTLASNVSASDLTAIVTSVIGIKIGDLVTFNASGGTAGIVIKKVSAVDESLNKISFATVFSAGSTTGVAGDVVDVAGFKVQTFRKSTTGLVVEVETQLGSQWCTMEPEVTQYYAPNVHATNRYLILTDQSSASTTLESFPEANATPTYLSGGAYGTTASTSAHWALDLQAFNNLDVRIISLVESTDTAIQKSVETYCKSRDDTPLCLPVLPENQTKTQLLALGALYQRSDDVMQVNVADWVGITDPFNTAPNANYRYIPNTGAVMGAWVRTMGQLGVHYIPCVDAISLSGIQAVENANLTVLGDQDRTDLAQYGINIIQFVNGSGYRIRNFFTPSITTAYLFANGLIMRNYIKVSSQQSLASSENYPNSFTRITEDGNAVKSFLYKLWFTGSTGNAPAGETFGVSVDPVTGNPTTPEDHFTVEADAINNPQSQINLGVRTITTYFTYPTPAGTIEIQVGIMLR